VEDILVHVIRRLSCHNVALSLLINPSTSDNSVSNGLSIHSDRDDGTALNGNLTTGEVKTVVAEPRIARHVRIHTRSLITADDILVVFVIKLVAEGLNLSKPSPVEVIVVVMLVHRECARRRIIFVAFTFSFASPNTGNQQR